MEADVEKKKSELKTQRFKAKVEIAKLEKLQGEAFLRVYAANDLPFVREIKIKEHTQSRRRDQGVPAGHGGQQGQGVSIIELNDAKPEYHPEHKYMPFHPAEQDIYKTVRCGQWLGVSTRLMPYMVGQGDSKLDKLLSCFSKRGNNLRGSRRGDMAPGR